MSNLAITWAYRQPIRSCGRKAVLVALADKADEDHSCWPRQMTLAEMTGQCERSVRSHLKQLEAEGYIGRAARYRNGHRCSDRYVLPVSVAVGVHEPQSEAKPASNLRAEVQPANVAGSQPAEVAGMSPQPQLKPASDAGSKPASSAGLNPQLEPSVKEQSPRKRGGERVGGQTFFEAFWIEYPRKVGKKAAAKAFAKAVKEGADPHKIIEGAVAYDLHTGPGEERYIKHPTTWLNHGCWDDVYDNQPLPRRNHG